MNKRTLWILALLLAALALSISGYLGVILYYAAWTFLVLVGIFVLLAYTIPIPINEDDVFDALSLTVWKTALEIEGEIKQAKGISDRWHLSSIVSSYLNHLEADRCAEKRERALSAERLEIRGGYPQYEFRKKSGGHRRRLRVRRWDIRSLVPHHAM